MQITKKRLLRKHELFSFSNVYSHFVQMYFIHLSKYYVDRESAQEHVIFPPRMEGTRAEGLAMTSSRFSGHSRGACDGISTEAEASEESSGQTVSLTTR
jgi:hypothetical protein